MAKRTLLKQCLGIVWQLVVGALASLLAAYLAFLLLRERVDLQISKAVQILGVDTLPATSPASTSGPLMVKSRPILDRLIALPEMQNTRANADRAFQSISTVRTEIDELIRVYDNLPITTVPGKVDDQYTPNPKQAYRDKLVAASQRIRDAEIAARGVSYCVGEVERALRDIKSAYEKTLEDAIQEVRQQMQAYQDNLASRRDAMLRSVQNWGK